MVIGNVIYNTLSFYLSLQLQVPLLLRNLMKLLNVESVMAVGNVIWNVLSS